MLKGAWKIPLKIPYENKWLNLKKDIWSIIFEKCLSDDFDETTFVFYSETTNILRSTCKYFATLINPNFLLKIIYSCPSSNLHSFFKIKKECEDYFCDAYSLSPFRHCSGYRNIKIPNIYKDKKDVYLRKKWYWNYNPNREIILSIRKRDQIKQIWRPK